MNPQFRAQYLDQPSEVSIETRAVCNARCTFCPYPTLTRKGAELPDVLIHNLIDEMSSFTQPFAFSPFKVNEPFLDVRLISFLLTFEQKCKQGRLRLFTNGSPLTRKLADEIAALKRVEHLWISLNSCDPQEYESIMGIAFERTALKLDFLHASEFPHPVVLSKVADDDRERNMHFMRACMTRWPRFTCRLIKRDGWLGYVEPGSTLIPDQPCSRWFELSVMATGEVALCCMDGTGEFSIGNVWDHSLLEIYNSPYWRSHRTALVSRKYYDPCKRCTY